MVRSSFGHCHPLNTRAEGSKMALLGPKMAEHGRLADVPEWSTGSKMINKTCYWSFGAILGPLVNGICLRIMHVQRIPKVSIFMAVTTKIVIEKAQKWPKLAQFWPKSHYNGRVMAREVLFYQCLRVTKLCAKFGCSRTPRTASIHKSFIVLRCMWKEPAPFSFIQDRSSSGRLLPQSYWNRHTGSKWVKVGSWLLNPSHYNYISLQR